MKELIDESIVLSEARMVIEDAGCIYILVEGESDRLFYRSFWEKPKTVVFRKLGGWENVFKTIIKANEEDCEKIIGIIDKDYHVVLEDDTLYTPNLLLTDFNDIEMILFLSSAYEKFLNIWASENKLSEIGDPRECVLNSAFPVGALRLLSKCKDCNLDFDELDFKSFVCKDTLVVNDNKLVGKVYQRTCSKGIKIPHKKNYIQDELLHIVDRFTPIELCNGHDVFEIICIAMTKVFATHNANKFSSEDVFKILMTGYSQEEFFQTELFRSYKEWLGESVMVG